MAVASVIVNAVMVVTARPIALLINRLYHVSVQLSNK